VVTHTQSHWRHLAGVDLRHVRRGHGSSPPHRLDLPSSLFSARPWLILVRPCGSYRVRRRPAMACRRPPPSPSISAGSWRGLAGLGAAELPPSVVVSPPLKEKGASTPYCLLLFLFLLFCLIIQSTTIASPISIIRSQIRQRLILINLKTNFIVSNLLAFGKQLNKSNND